LDYRIEVFWQGQVDGRAVDLLAQIAHLGMDGVQQAQVSNLFLRGTLAPEALERLAIELLADPVVEGYRWRRVDDPMPPGEPEHVMEVSFRPGVADPVAWHLLRRVAPSSIAWTSTRRTWNQRRSSLGA
jgi:phosphoribosylformylglycinamidine (FGAM) synthase PurS component